MSVVPCQVSGAYFGEAALFKMSIEFPATTIHHHDMTEKLLKAALNSTHKHTCTHTSSIQKSGHKFARIPFDTVPHKSQNAINIDFSTAFWYLYVLSGILVAFRYFGAFRSLYAPRNGSLQQPAVAQKCQIFLLLWN